MTSIKIENDTDIDESPIKKSASQFEDSWFQNAKYKSWIGYGSTKKKAFCTYCSCEVAANRGSLLKHNRSRKHLDKAKLFESLLKLIDVRSDADVPLDYADTNDIAKAFCNSHAGYELESIMANIVGQEKGILFSSHSMANLVAALAHCQSRDAVVILGSKSQMMMENRDSMIKLAGLRLISQPTLADGSFEMPILNGSMFAAESPGLVCVESAHFFMGGTIPDLSWLNQIADLCELYNFKCHYDGSRLLQAAVSKDLPPIDFVKGYDSVTVSIVKGLGAPSGAILCGSNKFIRQATLLRDELGCDLTQSGMTSVVAMKNLPNYKLRLRTAHQIAVDIGQKMALIQNSSCNVGVVAISTNIVCLEFDCEEANTRMFSDALAKLSDEQSNDSSVLVTRLDDSKVILEINPKISSSHVNSICRKITTVLERVIETEDNDNGGHENDTDQENVNFILKL